jgi:hypothetical protein
VNANNEELHHLYSSPNIVRVIKSRKMRCEGHVPRTGEGRVVYSVLVEKTEGKRIILRWLFRKWGCGGMDWIGLTQDRDVDVDWGRGHGATTPSHLGL